MVSQETGSSSDTALVERIGAGDRAAMAELYERHRAAIRTVAGRYAAQKSDRDDIINEAFLRVFTAIEKGTAKIQEFRPYLVRAARNVATEWGRRQREDADDSVPERHEVTAPADAAVIDGMLLNRAIRSLPGRWQRALWWSEVESRGNQEVGTLLGISPNATAALLARAREGLRSAWLDAHIATNQVDQSCQPYVADLARLQRGRVKGGRRDELTAHTQGCHQCAGLLAHLEEVDRHLPALLPPLAFLMAPGIATAGTASAGMGASIGKVISGSATTTKVALPVGLALVASAAIVAVMGLSEVDTPTIPETSAAAQAPTTTSPLVPSTSLDYDGRTRRPGGGRGSTVTARAHTPGALPATHMPQVQQPEDEPDSGRSGTPGSPDTPEQQAESPLPSQPPRPSEPEHVDPLPVEPPPSPKPTPTDPPQVDEPQETEPPEDELLPVRPAPPVVTSRDLAPRMIHFPHLSGRAVAGATVIIEADGDEIISTRAAEDGRWHVVIDVLDVDEPAMLTARQKVGDLTSSAAVVAETLTMLAPSFVDPYGTWYISREDLDGNGRLDDVPFELVGVDHSGYQVAFDGKVVSHGTFDEDNLARAVVQVTNGRHTVALRYFDQDSGRYGPWESLTVNVSGLPDWD